MFYKKKNYENDTKIILPQIRAKCITHDINELKNYGQCQKASLSNRMN